MNEMTKYDKWFEQESRTVHSRGIVFDREQMVQDGIIEVINYRAIIDDGLNDQARMHQLVRRGIGRLQPGIHGAKDMLDIATSTRAVLVDTAIRSVNDNHIRVYSGIVFVHEWAMNLFVMRKRLDYPNLLLMPRLSN